MRPTWDEIRAHHRTHADDLGASWWRVSHPTHAELVHGCVSEVRVTAHTEGVLHVEVHRGATVAGVDVLGAWDAWAPLDGECGEVVAWPWPPPRSSGARM